MPLPSEVEASYTAIIDSILATSDLNTVSEKRIRKGLEAAVQDDLTPQKNLIKELIMTRFDKFHAETSAPPSSPGGSPPHSSRNGQVAQDDSSSDVVQRKKTSPLAAGQNGKQGETAPSVGYESLSKPPKKKRKVAATDDDARLAAMLQAEENSRSRPTRGAAARKVPSIKKRKGSSKNKSRAEQDSSAESESGEKKKRASNKNGAFHKRWTLSPPLADFLGETALSRPETVKRLWAYFREKELQDPKDRRQIRCDDALKAIFKQDRVHMFTMNKILNDHLFAPDE